MQRLITDLWHEVEATVFVVTHSLSEAVYLGDRVWIMTRAPGRLGEVFDDVLPPPRGGNPMEIQESREFKEIVAEVGRAFTKMEAGNSSEQPAEGD
jgi:NitT/TauT family transport system ATP-binding protein